VNEGREELDLNLRSGALEEPSVVLLKDYERAFVWIGDRFVQLLPAGLYASGAALLAMKVKVADFPGG